MFEFIAGILVTPVAMLAFIIVSVLSDHADRRGLALMMLTVALGTAYFMFDLALMNVLYIVLAWALAGSLYSIFRWVLQCRSAADEYEKATISRDTALLKCSIGYNSGLITYWVVAWPISLTAWVLTKPLSMLASVIQFVCGNAYRWISDQSRSKIQAIADNRNDN